MSMKWRTGGSKGSPKPKVLLAGMVGLVLLAGLTGCGLLPQEEAEEALPTINPPKLSKKPEYPVRKDTLFSKVRGSGKLMSMKEEDVYFLEENKRIKEIYVKTGDRVEAGQLVAELDVTDLESQLRQKKLESRSEELKMIELLRNPGDKSAAELEQAKISFELKREELVKLEESISRSKISATFSGEVVAVYKKKGDMSKAYEGVATVADLSQLTVAASVSQEDLKKVAVGMEVNVDINSAGQYKGTVKQLPNPNKTAGGNNPGGYYGGFDGSGQQRQPETPDQFLQVELEKLPEKASRGTPLSVEVIVQKKENALVIPAAALRSMSGRNYVQVVDDKGVKREVDVEIGMQTSTDVEIVKGLASGQKVVGR
ncbi:efflux RND transporter periplasmic adaptor subunit [Gorillibacterium sp. sgz5001074]|uniref:efflux RND transporter periplasmic adaptor subunit n=1 Tax=Gorillibacterium sp. sgz5001074 TaxID=3446695 RepID=UPI003F6737D1